MNQFKALYKLIKNPRRIAALLSYGHKGYLDTIGWFNAFEQKQSVGHHNTPLPWVTYSFIDFIKPRLHKELSIFEYGSGNSTLFYAPLVKRVVSVEHDEDWYKKIVAHQIPNGQIIFSRLEKGGEYCQKAPSLNEKFDVVVVDGRDRVNCCKQGTNALSKNGVLILDDSERADYNEARIFLIQQGFKEIAFSGISPGLFYYKSTSVFYKPDNCLGI